jgi:Bacterial SH3 domain
VSIGPGRPAYTVPAVGMAARAIPDARSSIVAHLDPGLTVELVERRGDWANIICSNGWLAWVDARELMAAEGPPRVLDHGAPTRLLDQQPASSMHATSATKELQPAAASVSWSKSRRLRLVVSLGLCIASPLIYVLGA